MKKVKSLLLTFSLVTALFVSCGKNAKDELSRTWKVTEIETSTKLPDTVKDAMLANSTMVFTKDGNYTTTGGIGADQGTYTLDKDEKQLSTVSTSGKSNSVYTIDKLSKEELVLINNGNTVTCIAVK